MCVARGGSRKLAVEGTGGGSQLRMGRVVAGRGGRLAADDLAQHGEEKLGNVGPLAAAGKVQHAVRDECGGEGGGGRAAAGAAAGSRFRHLLGDDGELARLDGGLEPLLPGLVEDSRLVAGVTAGSLCAEALVELDTDALELVLALLALLLIVLIGGLVGRRGHAAGDGAGAEGRAGGLGGHPLGGLLPVSDAIRRGVADGDALLLLVLVLCPLGALPGGQASNLETGESERVKGTEEAAVPGPAAEADAVCGM